MSMRSFACSASFALHADSSSRFALRVPYADTMAERLSDSSTVAAAAFKMLASSARVESSNPSETASIRACASFKWGERLESTSMTSWARVRFSDKMGWLVLIRIPYRPRMRHYLRQEPQDICLPPFFTIILLIPNLPSHGILTQQQPHAQYQRLHQLRFRRERQGDDHRRNRP